MAPMTGIIDMHKNWRCATCGIVNQIQMKICTGCGTTRKEGTHALTSDNLKIGTLGTVFADGREHWLYDKTSVDAIVIARGGLLPNRNGTVTDPCTASTGT
ncbi:unnamed protein product [Fusarium graminearum]|uniref:Chromosome 1, complete genome n=2 Tax=Gibberella zeae TaxID=5518 RepID=I1R9K9_GIBZE|nr:hypothetical protein FGSG_00154 [Fusarium graminearum PH-1]ESU05276.1 hypothetical protein FGSG_00154 [Fusarium graminearum PH-1]CEF72009.1 unnamed protein product [Fusarium graminearum]CZS75271.1 unnamed protein product [Fusarium graminearum]|eukprot:XP_011315761.1 hypothetical protein FGSG_00154 [Fusarium graminearum PH-1]